MRTEFGERVPLKKASSVHQRELCHFIICCRFIFSERAIWICRNIYRGRVTLPDGSTQVYMHANTSRCKMIIRISGSEFRTKQEVCNEIRSNKSYLIDKLGRYVEREQEKLFSFHSASRSRYFPLTGRSPLGIGENRKQKPATKWQAIPKRLLAAI